MPLSCPFGRLSSDTVCHYLPLFGIAFRPGSGTICHYPVLLGGCVATLFATVWDCLPTWERHICHYPVLLGGCVATLFATICHCLGLPSDLGATLFATILSFWAAATLFATISHCLGLPSDLGAALFATILSFWGGCVATLFATVWDCLPTWERHYLPLSCPFGRLSSDTICHYLPLFGIAFRPGSDTICHYPVLLGGCVATLFATICHCLGLPSDLGATLFDTILSFWGCVATLFATLGQPAMAILIFESNLVVWGARGGSCHSVSPAAREHEKRVGTCRPMSLAAVQTRLTQIGFYRRLYRHVRERRERSCCKKCCSCSRRWLS